VAPVPRALQSARPARALPLLLAVVFWGVLVSPEPAGAQFQSQIGYTEIQAELGGAIPTGSSVSVTQTEAPIDSQGDYFPDTTNSEFAGKTLNALSGASGVSSHATEVGQYYYGSITSTAPGVQTVDVYNANDWILQILNYGTTSFPAAEVRPFENHSWIGTIDNGGPDDLEALQRFDYAMQTSGFLGVVGLNNGSNTTIPQLLACAYDSISVGLTNGNHSTGATTVDGSGRIKPEIVAPFAETSFATPMVSAAGVFLLDAINGNSAYAHAGNNVTLKAILLAGATKSEIPSWSRTPTQPLDSHYGAGQLNIYDSYHILAAGQQPSSGSSSVRPRGWDFSSTTASGNFYFFQIAAGDSVSNFSALLTWNAIIKSSSSHHWQNVTTTLPTLALNIYSANNFTIGSLIDSSVSTVDNVQHLYEPDLPPGQYALEVTANTTGVAYGLAWYSIPTVTIAASAPNAYEQGLVPGTFVITRAGETVDPLTVTYTIGGTAVNGSDYAAIQSTAIIPAGAASVAIEITPLGETLTEEETVVLTLATDFGYSVGGAGAATVTLSESPPVISVDQPPGNALSSGNSIVNFGTALDGANGNAIVFTISNNGGQTLTLGNIAVGGANASDFPASTAGLPGSLAPGANASLTVSFNPSVTGAESAALQIATDDPVTPTFTVNLTGQGTDALSAAYSTAQSIPITSDGFIATGDTVSLALGFAPPSGTVLTVIQNTGTSPIQGTFSNLAQGQSIALSYGGESYQFVANYNGGANGLDLVLQLAANVPAASSSALILLLMLLVTTGGARLASGKIEEPPAS